MTRLKLSFDGKIYNGTADVTGQGIDRCGYFVDVEFHGNELRIYFDAEAMKKVEARESLVHGVTADGRGVYVTGLQLPVTQNF